MPSYEGNGYAAMIGPGYVSPEDKGNKELAQMQDHFYFSNYTGNSSLWMQGAIDKRFKVGDQQLYTTFYGQNSQMYQKFFFPLIRRHINMICGYQRKNRKSTIVTPIEEELIELRQFKRKILEAVKEVEK